MNAVLAGSSGLLTRRGAAGAARRPGSPAAAAGDPGRGLNAPGGNDPDRLASAHSGGASTSSAELRASLDRAAAAAEEELRVTKAELEEARMMVASSEENLRGLSEAYNGLELEVSKRDDELEALRARLEIFEGADAASAPAAAGNPRPQTPDPAALAAAREEGRREAISEMAHRLEETEEAAAADVADARERGAREAEERRRRGGEAEAGDLLACLGREESKTEALAAGHPKRRRRRTSRRCRGCAEEEAMKEPRAQTAIAVIRSFSSSISSENGHRNRPCRRLLDHPPAAGARVGTFPHTFTFHTNRRACLLPPLPLPSPPPWRPAPCARAPAPSCAPPPAALA